MSYIIARSTLEATSRRTEEVANSAHEKTSLLTKPKLAATSAAVLLVLIGGWWMMSSGGRGESSYDPYDAYKSPSDSPTRWTPISPAPPKFCDQCSGRGFDEIVCGRCSGYKYNNYCGHEVWRCNACNGTGKK